MGGYIEYHGGLTGEEIAKYSEYGLLDIRPDCLTEAINKVEKGLKGGYDVGYEDGYESGLEDGYTKGFDDAYDLFR